MARKKIKVRAGRGTIYRRADTDAYRAQIMIGGEHLRRNFPDEESAQKWLEEVVRRSYKYGIGLDKAKITFAELARLFLEQKELENRRATTLQDYTNTLNVCIAVWGEIPVQHLTAEHVVKLMLSLKQGLMIGDKKRQPMAPKTIRNWHGIVHACLSYGGVLDIIDRNVADKVKAPSLSQPAPKAWDHETLQRFLRAIAGQRDEAIWWLIGTTGLRKGELVGLKWEDLDRESGEVVVKRRVVRLQSGIDIAEPKTRAGSRVINLPAIVLEKLEVWLHQQQVDRMLYSEWEDQGWVFTTRTGKHLEPRWLNTRIAALQDDLKLPRIPVHGLRHSFATWLLRKNVPIKDVSDVLGHSKPTVTLNLYWQSIPGAGKRAAAKVEELLGGNWPGPEGGADPTNEKPLISQGFSGWAILDLNQ